jgi:hypothetical protein
MLDDRFYGGSGGELEERLSKADRLGLALQPQVAEICSFD